MVSRTREIYVSSLPWQHPWGYLSFVGLLLVVWKFEVLSLRSASRKSTRFSSLVTFDNHRCTIVESLVAPSFRENSSWSIILKYCQLGLLPSSLSQPRRTAVIREFSSFALDTSWQTCRSSRQLEQICSSIRKGPIPGMGLSASAASMVHPLVGLLRVMKVLSGN